jgi:hypothetical protein
MQLLYTTLIWARDLSVWAIPYVAISGQEYARHRCFQHKGLLADWFTPALSKEHRDHHERHPGRMRKNKPTPKAEDWAAKEKGIEIAYLPSIFTSVLVTVALWWLLNDPRIAIATLVLGILHPFAYNAFHHEYHFKEGKRFSNNWLYKYLWWRHFLHHRRWKGNFNVVLPLWDLLFWTRIKPTALDRSDFQDLWQRTRQRITVRKAATTPDY